MASPYAFVTLISSDSYLPGALALAGALTDVHPSPSVDPEVDFQTVCLVTPETVDVSSIKLLRRAYNVVIGVEIIRQEDDKNLKLLGRLDLNTVLTKLHIFRLTQYSKIIFLDADVLPVRPLSHLFKLPHEFSAVPDVGWPDIFNSGVMVLSPSEEKFNQLNELLKTKGSWDGGDQGILNEWLGKDWNRLSFTYNTTPTAAYTYAPAYKRFGSAISAIHFIGAEKPWNAISYRPPFSLQIASNSTSTLPAFNYESLVDRWFAVYDKHYRSVDISSQPSFEVHPYTPAWYEPKSNGTNQGSSSVLSRNAMVLSLDELRKLAIEGFTASGKSPISGKKVEGEYRSLPLEGRLDLMALKISKMLKETDFRGNQRHGMDNVLENQESTSTPLARSSFHLSDSRHCERLPYEGPSDVPADLEANSTVFPTSSPIVPFHNVPRDIQHVELSHESEKANGENCSVVGGKSQNNNNWHEQNHHEHNHHHHHSHSSQHCGHFQHEPHQQPRSKSHVQQHEHGHSHNYAHSQNHQHSHQEMPNERYQQHQHLSKEYTQENVPRRPISPPLLVWNTAVDPPPTTVPTGSNFLADTYFPNIWDQTPSRNHDKVHAGHAPPDSGGFFQPPPPSEIPELLLKQGHYRNVTGETQSGTSPSPDRSKVKKLFPWEEKPRTLPHRIFPDSDAPPPSLFLSPGSQSSAVASATPESKHRTHRTQHMSPLYGLPSTLTYANAWDNVPSITKYASKLVRPQPSHPNLAPAFDDEGWRKTRQSWDEKVEASSQDGDDEDNADDDDEPVPNAAKRDDGSEVEESQKALTRCRSKSASSVSATHSMKGKKREYRMRGVQTIAPEQRSQGVQVDLLKEKPTKFNGSTKKDSPAPTSSLILPLALHETSTGGTDIPININVVRSPMPSLALNPRSPVSQSPVSRSTILNDIHSISAATRPPSPKVVISLIKPATPAKPDLKPSIVTRQISNDSSVGSPLSSVGPLSPQDGQPIASSLRRGSRVWDPARGVDLFKRGSEEVLARFLKMGSWDDDGSR